MSQIPSTSFAAANNVADTSDEEKQKKEMQDKVTELSLQGMSEQAISTYEKNKRIAMCRKILSEKKTNPIKKRKQPATDGGCSGDESQVTAKKKKQESIRYRASDGFSYDENAIKVIYDLVRTWNCSPYVASAWYYQMKQNKNVVPKKKKTANNNLPTASNNNGDEQQRDIESVNQSTTGETVTNENNNNNAETDGETTTTTTTTAVAQDKICFFDESGPRAYNNDTFQKLNAIYLYDGPMNEMSATMSIKYMAQKLYSMQVEDLLIIPLCDNRNKRIFSFVTTYLIPHILHIRMTNPDRLQNPFEIVHIKNNNNGPGIVIAEEFIPYVNVSTVTKDSFTTYITGFIETYENFLKGNRNISNWNTTSSDSDDDDDDDDDDADSNSADKERDENNNRHTKEENDNDGKTNDGGEKPIEKIIVRPDMI